MRASVLHVLNGDIGLGSALLAVRCVREGIILSVAPIRGENPVTPLELTQLLLWSCHHSLLCRSHCLVVIHHRADGLPH